MILWKSIGEWPVMASDGQLMGSCPSLSISGPKFLFDLGKIFRAYFSSYLFKKMCFYQVYLLQKVLYQTLCEEKSIPNKIRQKPLPKKYWKKPFNLPKKRNHVQKTFTNRSPHKNVQKKEEANLEEQIIQTKL